MYDRSHHMCHGDFLHIIYTSVILHFTIGVYSYLII